MTKLALNFYQDPGHGWVKINKKWLALLQIEDKITHYSYMRKDYAYLEEDNDLSTLFAAADNVGIKISLKEFSTDKLSKIRSYCSYQHKAANIAAFMQHLKDTNKIEFISIGV